MGEQSDKASLRVLIMDDDDMVRGILKKIFQFLKCEVDDVDCGEEAVEKYRGAITGDQGYDLAILDLRVNNGMGGVEAAREIIGMHRDAFLVVASGDSIDPVMENYQEYHFAATLTKPFTFDSVSELLNRVGGSGRE